MTANTPTEIELLRAVASAAAWAIESNGDDVVGRDGRARVGMNWIAANGALNKALKALRELHEVEDVHEAERAQAQEFENMLRGIATARPLDAESATLWDENTDKLYET